MMNLQNLQSAITKPEAQAEDDMEMSGYILDLFDGSAWITQDGQVTVEWSERGVWPTAEAAAEAMQRCLSANDQADQEPG